MSHEDLREDEKLFCAFEPQMSNRFLVTHPNIPSYLIKGYLITEDKLTLLIYVVHGSDFIKHLLKMSGPATITLKLLDKVGDVGESITFTEVKLVDKIIDFNWSNDGAAEAKLVYDITDVTNG